MAQAVRRAGTDEGVRIAMLYFWGALSVACFVAGLWTGNREFYVPAAIMGLMARTCQLEAEIGTLRKAIAEGLRK
jgi:hypothetical protein